MGFIMGSTRALQSLDGGRDKDSEIVYEGYATVGL